MDKAYKYAFDVVGGKINAPKYVKKQCRIYLDIADGKDEKYCINEKKKNQIEELTKLLIVPRGLCANKTVYEVLGGFQWLFIFAVLTVVFRNDLEKRRYETGILEICRKNGKTFLIAVVFIILFFTEPKFSKFFSVAPDRDLSKEIKTQIKEIIATSPALEGKFKVRQSDILCILNENDFMPLAFSVSRLDGRLPNAFVADEVGALPTNYPIEAMRSGQLMINNKLGCIISTKYPTIDNPFEDEIETAKQVLDGIVENDSIFALLYEPDNTKDWESDDSIIEQSNPLALEIPSVFEVIKQKRTDAILSPRKRENFLTKHCNIIYQGAGTETYVDTQELIKCRVDNIDWIGRTVYLGVDLSQTTDNTAVAMVALDDDRTTVLADVMAFIPEGRIDDKNREEKLDYNQFVRDGQCIACGDRIIDYSVVEEYVFQLEKKFGCKIAYIGFDRANAMSSAQKWDKDYTTVEIRQHSTVLHPATKLLKEKILSGEFAYKRNKLLEINFQNAMIKYSENMNMYVTKKRSRGKVDMVVALINAIHLLNTYELIGEDYDWIIQS